MTVRQPTHEGTTATPGAMRRRDGVRVGNDALLSSLRDLYELRGPFVWRLQGVDYDPYRNVHVNAAAERTTNAPRPGWVLTSIRRGVVPGVRVSFPALLPLFGLVLQRVQGAGQGALDAEVGQPLFPIGRHTIMNRFGLQASPKPTDAEIATFVARSGTTVERINRLRGWGHAVVRNLVTIGREDTASVPSRST